MNGPDDPASQNASAAVSSEFCVWNNFKASGFKSYRLLQPVLNHNPKIFPGSLQTLQGASLTRQQETSNLEKK